METGFSTDDTDPTNERASELITTSYIFPELVISSLNSASISLPVIPVNGVHAVFSNELEPPEDSDVGAGVDGRRTEVNDDIIAAPDAAVTSKQNGVVSQSTSTMVLLKHLPPVQLTVTLPDDYPTYSPPDVQLQSKWIPNDAIERLKSEIRHLWEDNRDQVVYAVIDHMIQSSEVLFQAGTVVMHESQPRRILEFPNHLKHELVMFDKIAQKEGFEKGTYECGVCLEPKKGSACHSLYPCNHVFCKACLQDFYTSCIQEGDVSSVKCLDTTCILNKKKKQPLPPPPPPPPNPDDDDTATPAEPEQPLVSLPPTLPPSELSDIGLSEELVTRYKRLKRKLALDSDPNTIYCPRTWCQAPSRESVEEMDRRIGSKGFYVDESHLHPDKEPEIALERAEPKADPKNPEKFYDKDGYEKDRMGICSECSLAFCNVCLKGWHGYFQVCRPINAPLTAEEIASEEYLKSHAMKCPTCLSWCIKSHGCNHMSCKCGTHFCFLCGAYLEPSNPYIHFNTQANPCFMRLWEGEDGDGEDPVPGDDDDAVGELEVIADPDDELP